MVGCRFRKSRGFTIDTPKTYREIVKQVIRKYAKLRPSHGNIRLDTVFDEQSDRYALMQVGWNRGKRVRENIIYIISCPDN
ncbi:MULTISPECIES: element excision factor XisI family protein [Okeania]|uniref:element excision factor XisI family protein n=1 Tax=Okeania TaxID=1458928 RepID=UPI003083FB9D